MMILLRNKKFIMIDKTDKNSFNYLLHEFKISVTILLRGNTANALSPVDHTFGHMLQFFLSAKVC